MKLNFKHNILFILSLLFAFPNSIVAQVNFSSSNLPIIIMETNGQNIPNEPKIVVSMKIIDNGERLNYLSDTVYDYNGLINIEIRGSTSQRFPKKQYGFETINTDGSNRNVSLMGFPAENDWILSAPYSDKALIRNILAYRLSENLGHYAPRTKLCEMVLNGDYQGVFVLTEKIKRDKNRVDIATLNPNEISGDDLTGGYLIKIDKTTGSSGDLWNSTIGGINFQYEYPKHDEIVTEQKEYIKSYIDSFELALSSDYFMDSETGFRKYIDENSFVDFFIANEVSKNIDGYFLSTYFFKDKNSKGGKLKMGPIWDFNLSFGNGSYREGYVTHGLQVEINPSPWWWDRLLQDPDFEKKIKSRWCNVRYGFLGDKKVNATIDSLTTLLNEAQLRNFTKWAILDSLITPNAYIGRTHEDEVNYLKTWTMDRLHWLDNRLSCLTPSSPGNDIVNVYPNPFSDYFTYDFSLHKSGIVSMILYDFNGTEVSRIINDIYYSKWGRYTVTFNTTEIPKSIYFIVLKIDNEIISSKKVLKF